MPRRKQKETAYQYKSRIEGIPEEEEKTDLIGRNPDGTFAKNNQISLGYGRPPNQKLADLLRQRLDTDKFISNIKTMVESDKPDPAILKLAWNYFDGMPREYKPLDDDKDKLEFLLWKIEKTCFDKQREVINSNKKNIIVRCPRRSGKTELFARLLLIFARRVEKAFCTYFGLTQQRAKDLLWKPVIDIATLLNIEVESDIVRGRITLNNGSVIQYAGNDDVKEREKRQGDRNDLIVIDESQSQQNLKYLIETILEPTLADRHGTLVIGGSEPRVRGTYFDDVWTTGNDSYARFKWTMFENPYMLDPKGYCEELLKKHDWTENEPTYRREYLGHACYDDDALVLRMKDQNYYTREDLDKWMRTLPKGDLQCVGGLDIGYEDADAITWLVYARDRKEVWQIYQKVIRREGIGALKDEIVKSIDEIRRNYYTGLDGYIMSDFGGLGKKICEDLYTQYGLPVQPAEKASKEAGIELLQDSVRRGAFKTIKGGNLDSDALKIVYARDDKDNLTRILDDSFHSDIFDATLYAYRWAVKYVAI